MLIRRIAPRGVFCAATVLLTAALSVNAAQAAGIAWHSNVQEATRQSAAQNKPLLVMVKARWCGPCHQMLEQTFPNPAVAARVNNQFVPLLIDADEQAAFVQSLGVEAMPTVLVISPQQKITGRLTGFQSANQLDAHLASLTPPAVRQVAPQAIRRWATPAVRPSMPPESGASFARRHAVYAPAIRPIETRQAPRARDTCAAAMEFSAAGAQSAGKESGAGPPVPQPPD